MAFSDNEIKQIIEAFLDMNTERQYIGARYVPIFGRKNENSIDWDNTAPYEPLTIVLYQGNSYTSRQYVPTGVDISNNLYWAQTGNYNAQIEQYRREVADIAALIPANEFDAENTVKEYIDTLSNEFYDDIEVENGVYLENGYVVVKMTGASKNNIKAVYDPNSSPSRRAIKNAANVVINAGYPVGGSYGVVIRDGEVIRNTPYVNPPSYLKYISFNNGEIYEYSATMNAQHLLNAGASNCAVAYYRMITDGEIENFASMGLPNSNYNRNPRAGVFVNEDNDICFIAVNGRVGVDRGLTPQEFAELMISLDAVNAWNLDGGGSTSLNYRCVKLNSNYDGGGTEDRLISTMFEVPNKADIPSTQQSNRDNGEMMQYIQGMFNPYMFQDYYYSTAAQNVRDLRNTGFKYLANATDAPTTQKHGFALFFNYNEVGKKVLWMPLGLDQLWSTEYTSSLGWNDWKRVDANYDTPIDMLEYVDLNEVVKPGIYRIYSSTTAATITNIPILNGGILIVRTLNQAGIISQVFIDAFNHVFIRCLHGESWEPWNDLNNYSRPPAIENVNLNTFTTLGKYRVSSNAGAATIENIPAQLGGILENLPFNSSDYIRQVYQCGGSDYYVRRVNVTTNEATDWVNLNNSI